MTNTNRAVAFWVIRVAIAILLVITLQAWRGPDPVLWYLAAGYAALSGVLTFVMIQRGR